MTKQPDGISKKQSMEFLKLSLKRMEEEKDLLFRICLVTGWTDEEINEVLGR